MKRIYLFIVIITSIVVCSSCTENVRSRVYGADMTVRLEPGEKLVEATWKENNLWYLVEPMDSTYIPKTKIFKENSSLGIIQGKVIFIEQK